MLNRFVLSQNVVIRNLTNHFHKKWCIIFFVLISVELCLTLLITVQLRSQGLSFRLPWRGREGKKIDPENEVDHCEVRKAS